MLPGLEMLACQDMAVSMEVMQHIINVESSRNPFAIGVVGGALARQPRQLDEALATARMLEERGYNFSIGLAQVNRYNLDKYGLDSYEKAFQVCPNVQAASRILAECYGRSGKDWGKAFSCYYSGNFTTGFQHGYVRKVFASIARASGGGVAVAPIEVIDRGSRHRVAVEHPPQSMDTRSLVEARIATPARDIPAGLAADDPARAYTVYSSPGQMVRDGLVRSADAALSRAVSGLANSVVGRSGAVPAEGMQSAAIPTQPVPATAAEGAVVLRPWSERNAPAPLPIGAGAMQLPVPSYPIPKGDAAFVF